MLVNIYHDKPAEHARLLLAGIAFLTTIAVLIGLSIGIYNKAFDDSPMVTVKADRAGLQLNKFGDVRRNGALVGQVREVAQDGEQASIKIALEPSAAQDIPSNVEVEILPTTLFGQKYLSLVAPDNPSSAALEPGAVIPASRVNTNTELQEVLADLFPLLRSIRPADLNATLNALANTLEGRGEQLGQTMEELGAYLGEIDQSLPTLRQNLQALADVADDYERAAPDLLRVLDNLTVTSKTVLDKREQLDVFFSDLTGLANTTTRVLRRNEDALIRVGELGKPVMQLLATYSPEFPCLLEGAANYAPILGETFTNNEVRQYIQFGTAQYEEYKREDLPTYGEVGHGPWCPDLPGLTESPPPRPLDQGTDIDENPPESDLPTSLQPRNRSAPAWARDSGFGPAMSSGYAGTEGEKRIVNALLAGRTGREADYYGSLGSLLYGPVVRGGEPVDARARGAGE